MTPPPAPAPVSRPATERIDVPARYNDSRDNTVRRNATEKRSDNETACLALLLRASEKRRWRRYFITENTACMFLSLSFSHSLSLGERARLRANRRYPECTSRAFKIIAIIPTCYTPVYTYMRMYVRTWIIFNATYNYRNRQSAERLSYLSNHRCKWA